MKAVLSLYGVPVVGERLTGSADEAVNAAAALGYPVVMKVESPDLPHKTEAGVIRLNLRRRRCGAVGLRSGDGECRQGVAAAAHQWRAGAADGAAGCRDGCRRAQRSAVRATDRGRAWRHPGGGVEGHSDFAGSGFGSGSGRDAAAAEGCEAAGGIPGHARLWTWIRLAQVISDVSRFVADHRDTVAELDVNPLICAGDRITAVDGLIVPLRG